MEPLSAIQSTQEQAVASWVNYLNQVRLDRLMAALSKEQRNLDKALQTIDETLETIDHDIVNNGLGRGGSKGMHGFIAEAAEVGVENARKQIDGRYIKCKWIDDNGPADLKRGSVLIQQKFVNSGNHLSLQAVSKHLEAYPDFLEKGGKYQIPADHYEKMKWLLSISPEEANKMPTSTGEFSMKQWREVHEFFDNGSITLKDLEPSALEYKSVQRDVYDKTLKAEKQSLRERNKERKDYAYQKNKATFQEGVKVTAVSAAVEGGMSLCLGIISKCREGKNITDFDFEDWVDIAGDTGIGAVKGGIRGSSIYLLTNYAATPAAVASAIATASFGIAEQAHQLRQGNLDETSFIENSEALCLDAAVSALSSYAGQVIIPIPVIGAVIGNAVGTMMYQIAKDNLAEREQALIGSYLESIKTLDEDLQIQYQTFVDGISEDLKRFMSILDRAFALDVTIAFDASVELAKEMGVPTEEIIDSREKLLEYFLGYEKTEGVQQHEAHKV